VLDRNGSTKIGGQLFLNCTKNIELTGALFARTVTFALTKKPATRPCCEPAQNDI